MTAPSQLNEKLSGSCWLATAELQSTFYVCFSEDLRRGKFVSLAWWRELKKSQFLLQPVALWNLATK